MKETAAGVFKANCLAVMDEVQAKRETVVITKHGKPVAKLVPVNTDLRRDLPLPRWQGCGYRRLRLACPYTGRMGRTLLILVDTHVVVWLAFGQSQISSQARAAIEKARGLSDGLAISDITLWEVGTFASRGPIRLGISLESFLQEIEARFVVLPITGRTCARAMSFPTTYPKDPADRIIGATALVGGLSLITADREIHRSKLVPAIW